MKRRHWATYVAVISHHLLVFQATAFTLLLLCVPLFMAPPELRAQSNVSTAAIVTDQSALDLSTKFGTPQAGAVNAAGDYAFIGEGNSALFLRRAESGTTERLLQINDPVPGISGGKVSSITLAASPGINASGHLAINVSYSLSDALTHSAILTYDGASFHTVVTSDDIAPGTGGLGYGALAGLRFNNAGDVRFSANLMPLGPTTQATVTTLFISPGGGAPVRVVGVGDSAPGIAGGVFGSVILQQFSNTGQVGFTATVAVTGQPNRSGLFLGSISGVQKVAAGASGTSGDVNPLGGNFTTVTSAQTGGLSDTGVVWFFATGSVAANSAIWSYSSGTLTPLVQNNGAAAPASIGGTINLTAAPGFLVANGAGDVLFPVPITGSGTTTLALLRRNSGGTMDVVAYAGQAAPGTATTFSSFSSGLLSSTGVASFVATLADGKTGLYQQTGAGAPVALAVQGQSSPVVGGIYGSLGSLNQVLDDGPAYFELPIVGGVAYYGEFRGTPGSIQTLMSTADNLPAGSSVRLPVTASDNADDLVSFTAQRNGGPVSLFVKKFTTGTTTKLVAEGDTAAGLGVLTSILNARAAVPFLNQNGQVVFQAVTDSGQAAIFVASTTVGLTKVVGTGDAAPVAGTTFSSLTLSNLPPSPLNDAGQVVFRGTLSNGASGIFKYTGGAIEKIMVTGDAAPGGGAFTGNSIGGTGNQLPAIDYSGNVIFSAVANAPGRNGLFASFAFGGGLSKVAAAGDPVPGGTLSTIFYVNGLGFNGQVAFQASSSGAGSNGLFVGQAGQPLRVIAKSGDPAPGGGTFAPTIISTFGTSIFLTTGANALLNGNGDVLFRSGITGGSADSGLFRVMASGPLAGVTQTVALQGQALPGGLGTLSSISYSTTPGTSLAFGGSGEAIFMNSFVSGGVRKQGVFLGRLDGTLSKILAAGDPVPGTDGVLSALSTTIAGGQIFGTGVSGGSANHTVQIGVTDDGTSPASTAIVSSANPSNFGQLVTFTATVSGAELQGDDGIAFLDNGTLLSFVVVNGAGQATFTTSALTPGVHTITAFYPGSGTSASSSSTLTQTVIDGPVILFPLSVAFPAQTVGTASAAQSVVLTNVSFSSLTLTAAPVVSGANASDFAVQPGTTTCTNGAVISPAVSCVVFLTFTPAVAGSRGPATLTISHNGTGGPALATLTGTGTVLATPGLSTPSLDFSNQTVYTTSASQSVTVTNSSGGTLRIAGLPAIAGTHAGDFAVQGAGTTCTDGAAIAPAGTCLVAVTFTPTATGARGPATLTIPHDAPGSALTVLLSGTGAAVIPGAGELLITTVAGGGAGNNPPVTESQMVYGGFFAGNHYVLSGNRIYKGTPETGWTVVAGTGEWGFSGDGGPATSAKIAALTSGSIIVDGYGNIYIVDTNNHRIRKVAVGTGIITTVAGNGSAGAVVDNIAATSSTLSSPRGAAVDAAGNLYIADLNHHRVRRVDAVTGLITTIAGTGIAGYNNDNIPATTAQLASPAGVSIGASFGQTYIYIADTGNRRIRRIYGAVNGVGGTIETIAGDGTTAQLNTPVSVFPGQFGYGDVVIADGGNNRIYRGFGGPTVEVAAGNGATGLPSDGGLAVNQPLSVPTQVSVDASGTIFFSDGRGVYRVLADGTLQIFLRSNAWGAGGDNGPAIGAQLTVATANVVDPAGNLYFTDSGNNRIRKVTAATGVITTVAGTGVLGFSGDGGGATAAQLRSPFGIGLDSLGNIYFTDQGNHRIRKITMPGGVITTIAGTGTAGFNGDGPATSAQLSSPSYLFVDSSDNIFVSDGGNSRIRRIDTSGNILTVAGTGTNGFSDGAVATAQISGPAGLFFDSAGNNLYFVDGNNIRVRMVAMGTNTISTIAGTGTRGFAGDGGLATAAQLNLPRGLTRDSSGNLYIADSFNSRIRKIENGTNIISTVVGSGRRGYAGDGALATNAEIFPLNVALDSAGNLLITEQTRIRKAGAAASGISLSPGALVYATQLVSTTSAPKLVTVTNTGTASFGILGTPDIQGTNSADFTVLGAGAGTTCTNGLLIQPGQTCVVSVTFAPSGSGARGPAELVVPNSVPNSGALARVSLTGTGTVVTPPLVSPSSLNFASRTVFTTSAAQLVTLTNTSATTALHITSSPTITGTSAIDFSIQSGGATTCTAGTTIAPSGSCVISITFIPAGIGARGPATLTISHDAPGDFHLLSLTGTGAPLGAGQRIITTIAGGREPNNVLALSAPIQPSGVAKDGAGNLYIGSSSAVFRVDIAGVLTRLAGTGEYGFSGDGGPATAATFGYVTGVSVDGGGNIFIADAGNNSIRKVNAATGIISTVAGNGTSGYNGDNIVATSASITLGFTSSLHVDVGGNIFIADYYNSRIRKVAAATGIITTVAGTGVNGYNGDNIAATSAQLSNPSGVSVDVDGNIFIAEGSSRIRKVTKATGIITTVAGTGAFGYNGDDIAATSAQLAGPSGVSVDGTGNIFIADQNNNRIRKVTAATGIITTVAGTGTSGYNGDDIPAATAQLGYYQSIFVDGPGDVLIADAGNNRIRKITASTGIITTVAGNGTYSYGGDDGPSAKAQFGNPFGLLRDNIGNIYFADTSNNRIRKIAAGTNIITTVAGNGVNDYVGDGGPATDASLQLTFNSAIWMGPAGDIYFGSEDNSTITPSNCVVRKFAVGGNISTVAGMAGPCGFSGDGGPATGAQLEDANAVAVDASGNVYIAGSNSNRIRRVLFPSGDIETFAGNGSAGYSGDGGLATAAYFNRIYGLSVDASGNVFLADGSNCAIRKIVGVTGIVTTVAGSGICGYSGDGGPATSARLDDPRMVFPDNAGNILFSDNEVMREVLASTGVIHTVAGGGINDPGDGGPATDADVNPRGIFVDAVGNIYFSDEHNRIRKVSALTTGAAATPLALNLDFFVQAVGTTSAAMTLTVMNTGASALNLTAAPAISGTHAGDFAIAAAGTTCTNGASIAPGGTCAVNVTFAPGGVGIRGPAFLTLTNNAADSPQLISLTGLGVTAVANVVISPWPVNFGSQPVLTTSVPQTVTVTNIGSLAATLSAGTPLTITGANAADFTIVSGTTTCIAGFVLNAGGSCVINITFTPSAPSATRTATLNVASNAPGSPHQVPLDGSVPVPVASVTPGTFTFSNQSINTTGTTQTFTVANVGTATLTVTSVALGGADPSHFIFTNTGAGSCVALPLALAPGGSCTFTVAFRPTTIGSKSATVTVTDNNNAVPGSTQVVTLSGTGTAPIASLSPVSPFSFGSLPVGAIGTPRVFTLSNTGNVSLSITSILLGGVDSSQFTLATSTGTGSCATFGTIVAAGSSCTFTVAFRPTTTGAKTATVTVTNNSNGVAGSTQVVVLNGTAVTATVGLNSSSISFGNQPVGVSSAALGVTMTNSGASSITLLTGSPVTISGLHPADFAVAGGTTCLGDTVLAASGGSCLVNITFNPGAVGARSAALSIVSDAPGSPLIASLSGTGIQPDVLLSATSLSFGTLITGVTSGVQSVTVTNARASSLNISTVALSGPNSGDFTTTTGTTCTNGTVLAAAPGPGNTCILNFTFMPSATGFRSATVTITDNAAGSPRMISLSGAGAAPGTTPIITTIAGGKVASSAPADNLCAPARLGGAFAENLYILSCNRVYQVSSLGVWNVVAGTGEAGFSGDGGPAINAKLSAPDYEYSSANLALDSLGNIFVADTGNSRIRKIDTATGIITTVAGGGGSFPGDGGPATGAALFGPAGVFVDSTGNIYFGEQTRVRKVASSTGIITTVAGNGTFGFSGDGGPATSAQLINVNSVSVDTTGNIFVSDSGNYRIREIVAATGIIQTVAGNGIAGFSGDGGPATSAQIWAPGAVAVDGSGNIFIADWANARVRKVTAGIIQTFAGGGSDSPGDGGPATSASLGFPISIVVDSTGNVFFADFVNYGNDIRIRRVDSGTGIIQTIARNSAVGFSGDGGAATSAQLKGPNGVAMDLTGNRYIADTQNNRIRKVSVVTGTIQTIAGGGFAFPGDGGLATSAFLSAPSDVAVDSFGNIFIAEDARVRKVAAGTGIISTVAGNGARGFSGDGGPATSAQLNASPIGISVDALGNIFIADYHNGRIRKVDAATGIIQTVAGGGAAVPGDGGVATSANVGNPEKVFVDSSGNIFFSDFNSRVRKVTAGSGIITTVAGNGSRGSGGDGGPATSAQIGDPIDVFVDASGNILIADGSNNRVRKVDVATGIIQTVAGSGVKGFGGDGGAATSSQLNVPSKVILDASGSLIIADSFNARIRRVGLPSAAVAFSADPITFAARAVGTTSVAQTITVTNGGTLPATLSGSPVTFTGANVGDFAVVSGTSTCTASFVLTAGGGSCVINITFTPGATGARAATLNVNDDAPGSPHTVALAGTGTSAGPVVSITPNQFSFGSQQVNTSTSQTFTVSNPGSTTLTITAVALGGTNANQFVLTNFCTVLPRAVAAGTNCPFAVAFNPTSAGLKTATVTITDNDNNVAGSTQVITVAGTGTAPAAAVTPASPFDFGNRVSGTASAAQMFTVTNSGTAPLTITSIALGGADLSQFVLSNTGAGSCSTLPKVVATSCTFTIAFSPTSVGVKSATVTVTDDHNGVSGSTQVTTLNGTGTLANVALTPSSVNFGNQRVGTSSSVLTATLTNNSAAAATLSAGTPVTITGANAADFAIVVAGTTCIADATLSAGGGSCIVNLTFTPGAAGARAATLNIADDVPGSPQMAALTGLGTVPVASVSPAGPVNFGNQLASTTSTPQTFTVSNTGLATLTITNIALGGTDPTQFVLTNAGAGSCSAAANSVPAGADCTFTVAFAPIGAGPRSATLTVTDDSNNIPGSTQVVNLNGTGVAPVAGLTPASPFDYGSHLTGTSTPQTFTVSNPGSATLTIASIVLSGTDAGQFALTNAGAGSCSAAGNTVPAGGNCTFSAAFNPTTTGGKTATITVTDDHNAVPGSTQVLILNGTGTAPIAAVSPAGPFNFGNVPVGTTSTPQTFTVSNTGSVALHISSIALGGTDASQFVLTNTGTCAIPATVAAAGNCTFSVTFNPTTTGAKTATITVTDDSNNVPGTQQIVILNGTGVVATVVLSPSPVSFGSQRVGIASGVTTVAVTNNGSLDAHLAASNAVLVLGANPGDFQIDGPTTTCVNGQTLTPAPGPTSTCNVGIRFNPTVTGARAATLTITDDAPTAGSQQTANLSGTGIQSAALLSATNVAFGSSINGTTSSVQSVTLTNTGTASLNIATVVKTGATSGDFLIAGGTTCTNGASLAASPGPGNTCILNFTFTPSASGARSATVTITDDAPGSPRDITLTGTGQTAPTADFTNVSGSGGTYSINFFDDVVGQGSLTTVTITNNGEAALAITSVVLSGADSAHFAISTSPLYNPPTPPCTFTGANVPSGTSCTFGVMFQPQSIGLKTAIITITDNANSTGTSGTIQTITLSGTGTQASVALAPNPLTFANQNVGTTSGAQTITVTNSGTASATLAAVNPVTFTGGNFGDFAVAAGGTTCVAGFVLQASPGPGNTCVINVTFTPGGAGARTTTINVADNSPGSPQTATVNGTGIAPVASLAPPSPFNYGNRVISTSTPQTITVSNTGLATLTISSIVLGGPDAGQFALTNTGAGSCSAAANSVPAGGNCTVSVAFNPTTTGPKTATVTVTDDHNAVPGSTQMLTLNGTGIAPIASLAPPSPFNYGNRVLNTSTPQTITVSNTGTSTLTITNIVLAGTDSGQFALTNTGAGSCSAAANSVPAGGSCTVSVAFNPTTTGPKTATVTVTDDHNAVPGSTQVLTLNGTGIAPIASLAPPSPFNYGSRLIGTSTPQTITVSNTGSATLTITNIVLGGADASQFALTNTGASSCSAAGNSVPAGGNCTFSVAFNPTTTGPQTATVTVTDDHNAVPGSTQVLTLNGTGIAPIATVSPAGSFDFGNVAQNTTSAPQTFTVSNTGSAALHVTNIVLNGTDATQFILNNTGTCAVPATVAAAGNCTFTIAFQPATTGPKAAAVTVTDDSNNVPGSTHVVNLNGTGVVATVLLTPSPVTFGDRRINTTSSSVTVTVTNSGTNSATLAASNPVSIAGTNASNFAIVPGTTTCVANFVLAASGGSCVIDVTFTPDQTNLRTATLNVFDNAPDSPQTVNLTGAGTAPIAGVTPASPFAFGNRIITTTSAPQTFTVSNTGTDALNITSIVLGGTDAGQFLFANAGSGSCLAAGNTVVPGDDCTFTVAFAPTTSGDKTASVAVTDDHNGVAGSTQVVDLTGTGQTSPTAVVAPLTIPFGNQRVETSSSLATTVTITNNGEATLAIASIALTGTDASQFSILGSGATPCNLAGGNVPGGANCTFTVTFSPTSTGAKNASVTITDNANSTGAPGTTQTVTLSGTGIQANLALTVNPTSFGNVKVGVTSNSQTLTLTNLGTDIATLSAGTPVTFTGGNFGDFAIVPGTTTCVADFVLQPSPGPDNTCVINVTFTPGATGARTTTINVADDAPGSPQTVTLDGTGVLANVALTPNPTAFGLVKQDVTSSVLTVTVTNSGTLAANLAASNAITIAGTNASEFVNAGTGTCANGTVLAAAPGPDNTCSVNITFTPGATGARTATLNIADDAAPGNPGTATQTATLDGTGGLANVTFSSGSFGGVNIPSIPGSTPGTLIVMVANAGTFATTLSAGTPVTITGTNAADFAIASGTTCVADFILAADGGSCVVNLTFTPGALGARTATLNVANDAAAGSPGTTTQAATLSGTGTQPDVTLLPASAPDFGMVQVGTTKAGSAITLTNSGTGPLTITGITIAGTNPGDFSRATTCPLSPATLPAAGTCTITPSMQPQTGSTGARSATVSIADNAAGNPHAIAVSGTGVDFSIDPPASSAIAVPAGQPATFTMSVATAAAPLLKAVTFRISALPRGAAATFNPPSLPAGSASANTALTITTTARPPSPATAAPISWPKSPTMIVYGVAFLLLFFSSRFGLMGRYRMRHSSAALLLTVVLAISTLIGCASGGGSSSTSGGGGGPVDNSTPAGPYNLTVTAESEDGVVRTTNVTLNVQ